MLSFPSMIPGPVPFPLDIGVGVVGSLLVLFLFTAVAILIDATASWRHGRKRDRQASDAVRQPQHDSDRWEEKRSIAA